jgi:hypothetical protein
MFRRTLLPEDFAFISHRRENLKSLNVFYVFTSNTEKYRHKEKYKVKLSLCLTKHHARKAWDSGGIAPRIL